MPPLSIQILANLISMFVSSERLSPGHLRFYFVDFLLPAFITRGQTWSATDCRSVLRKRKGIAYKGRGGCREPWHREHMGGGAHAHDPRASLEEGLGRHRRGLVA